MWNRKELKKKGKAALKANWLSCVIVEIILGILLAAQTTAAKSNADTTDITEAIQNNPDLAKIVAAVILSVSLVAIIIAVLMNIFIKNPLIVGGHRFFLVNSEDSGASAKIMFSAFKDGKFGNIFLTMFVRDFLIAIGCCLFVIPGVILSYTYMMVPYILAENPDMNWKDVLKASRAMMKGQKMKAFVLHLSFFGWLILSAFTCGVLAIFWVSPYMRATDTELYKTLKA